MSVLPDSLCRERITVVVGFSGSGKTEFSVNLALALAASGRKTALADLDVVNPYYRSRERRELLKNRGIRLIASSQACLDADVPSMPADLNTLLEDVSYTGVMDIGGSATGARVLARYQPRLVSQSHTVLLVLNGNRPDTGTPEGALKALRDIEEVTGVPVDGIVNNTHLCTETTPQIIEQGIAFARRVSQVSGIPIVCHSMPEELIGRITPPQEPVFPLHRYMLQPWEGTPAVE